MKQNREDIPFKYAHCFATDRQCPQRSGCLHALITELPMKTSQYASNIITAIDPRYVASLHGKGGCTFYRSSDLKRYACGMSRMFDAVPSRIVSEVRRCVRNCFTCRSYYFASRKGKRLISPAEQAEIASVFRALCPELRPIYDSFEERYEW